MSFVLPQLIESSHDVFKAVAAIDSGNLESLADIFHKTVTGATEEDQVSPD